MRGIEIYGELTYHSMGNLIGFEGFLNESAPFREEEHKAVYKTSQRYPDFGFTNKYLEKCDYPRFWSESGERATPETDSNLTKLTGCYDGDFDQVRITMKQGIGPWLTVLL